MAEPSCASEPDVPRHSERCLDLFLADGATAVVPTRGCPACEWFLNGRQRSEVVSP